MAKQSTPVEVRISDELSPFDCARLIMTIIHDVVAKHNDLVTVGSNDGQIGILINGYTLDNDQQVAISPSAA
jgi:hypothetical protein